MGDLDVYALMRKYLEMEESELNLTDKEVERSVNQAIATFGTINKVIEALQDYLEVR